MKYALAALLLLTACPKPAAAPVLDGTWPSKGGDYDAVTASWTRDGEISRDYQLVAKVHATMLSPPWREAWVERRVDRGKLGAEQRAALEDEQHAKDDASWEVEVVISTWDRDENDLDRGAKSIWRLVLVDGDGHEVTPTEIVRDRRPDEIIRSEFPAFDDFTRAYVARFPKTSRVLAPGVTKIELKLSSTRGGIEMAWP